MISFVYTSGKKIKGVVSQLGGQNTIVIFGMRKVKYRLFFITEINCERHGTVYY